MTIAIGLDVGSTTVKAVVVDPATEQILWKDYRRHETRQPETALDFLLRIGAAFPDEGDLRIFVTGSGSGPLTAPLGARFVQEVNAVTLAVEKLHPDVNAVVELGGQDAKIIVFRNSEDGGRTAFTSMNDKCASGTGATIDKCVVKAGMAPKDVVNLRFDGEKLHHVAAKCGVFAETDIVNLVKSGIPSQEILCSLADAIVHQNLSVLTRGNTLKPKVLLLGGPNTYLPFLVDCWRLRIPESWAQRGFDWPREERVEDLVFAPQDAQYYAAFGAVVFGLAELAHQEEQATFAKYAGLDGLRDYMTKGRASRLGASAAGPLVTDDEELNGFLAEYTPKEWTAPRFPAGTTVRGVIGLDGGSTSTKVVLVGEDGALLAKAYRLSKGNPIQDTKEILAELKERVEADGATLECLGFGATGYAGAVLEESVSADVNIVETVAHMAAATAYFPDADVVCDIGGQDIKVLFLRETAEGARDVKDFRLSNQCSAGNGTLLQAMADQFGVPLTQYADVAFGARLSPKFSYGCAVFLDADRVNFQKEGFAREEMLAGLARVLPKNVWQYVVQVPRLAQFGTNYVLQGGTQRNLAAVKAQVDYIKERVPGARVDVHPFCGEAGAIGAAFETLRVVKRRGHSTFIGLDAAIALQYEARTDESTRCHFCPNECSRTFIDTKTPSGRTSRYIAGFSCEKGTVESKEALKILSKKQAQQRAKFPNCVDEESTLVFKHFYKFRPLPEAGSSKDDVEVRKLSLFRVARKALRRGFQRSDMDRSALRIGLPRVLNMYSTGPFFRTFLEVLGVQPHQVVWSSPTSEEQWLEGGRYGSIDPCFPSKLTQAHIHELLHLKHKVDFLWYPCLTHVPSWITGTMDHATCPIVAGNPNVVKAAFTKETDFFKKAGVEYVDTSLSFLEPNLMKKKLFDVWGPRIGVTEDEVEWAVDEGMQALTEYARRMEARGKEIIEQVEREDRVALLVVGRPYHSDPGLNHGIPEEFQALGYPVLSIRSLPKDKEWLSKYFGADDPLTISDVWAENYSANSAQKVWAVRFAARHPNIAILDLSSFKCGHDAPTYGIVDKITSTAKVPWSGLHDLDQNKPGGSIAIRVRTYDYRLKRVEEELKDRSRKKAELARRIAEKRRALLGLPEQQVAV